MAKQIFTDFTRSCINALPTAGTLLFGVLTWGKGKWKDSILADQKSRREALQHK